MKYCLILLLIILTGKSWGSEIIGTAPAVYAGQEIHLIINQEEVSGVDNVVQSQIISGDGGFRFEVTLAQAQWVELKIMLRKIVFHLSPDETVEVSLKTLKNADNFTEPFRYTVSTIASNSKTAPDAVYEQYSSEVARQISLIDSRKAPVELNPIFKHLFDSLEIKYEDMLLSDAGFRQFTQYQQANAMLLGSYPDEKLYALFLAEKPILYTDPLYLSFAENLLLPRLENILFRNEKEISKVYSEFNIYEAMLSYIAHDSLFKNRELSSLAILFFAKKNIFKPGEFKQKAIDILDQIKEFSAYPVQQQIAERIFGQLHKLNKGRKAPDFTLTTRSGKPLTLTKFRHPVYLAFEIGGSTTFQIDRLIIQKQAEKFKTFDFVIVLVNFNRADWLTLSPDSRKNIHYVYFEGEYDLLERFGLLNAPLYYLIGPGGVLLQSPAKEPTEMFEVFDKLKARKSKYKSYEIVDE